MVGAGVQAHCECRTSRMGPGRGVAWETGRRLRLRGIVHRAKSSNLGRGLSCLVALEQCPTVGQPHILPGQYGDVAVAKGVG